jgi:MoaA/NifB/PqqE/SkfB family radical SAM enzyme
MSVPSLINWSVISHCNLNCGFCFKIEEESTTLEEKNIIFQKIVDAKIEQVTFTGGEPLLDEDIGYLGKLCNKHNIKSSLHTNGTLSEYFYRSYEVFDRISFSLDGGESFFNSEMRGTSDYFSSIIEKCKYLKEQKRDFTIKTVVTRQNIHYIFDMIPLIREIKPTFWSIFEFRPLRIGMKNQQKYKLEEK